MKRLLASALALAFLLPLTACGGADTHEKAAAESITLMQEFTGILAGVKDEASATAAKPKLEKLGEKMTALQARMEKLGEPSEEQQQEIQKMKGWDEAMEKFMAEAMRVGTDPTLGPILEDTMKEMSPGR